MVGLFLGVFQNVYPGKGRWAGNIEAYYVKPSFLFVESDKITPSRLCNPENDCYERKNCLILNNPYKFTFLQC